MVYQEGQKHRYGSTRILKIRVNLYFKNTGRPVKIRVHLYNTGRPAYEWSPSLNWRGKVDVTIHLRLNRLAKLLLNMSANREDYKHSVKSCNVVFCVYTGCKKYP